MDTLTSPLQFERSTFVTMISVKLETDTAYVAFGYDPHSAPLPTMRMENLSVLSSKNPPPVNVIVPEDEGANPCVSDFTYVTVPIDTDLAVSEFVLSSTEAEIVPELQLEKFTPL